MTALDQALIRAFQQQCTTPVAIPPQPAPLASSNPPLRPAERWPVGSPPAAAPVRQTEPEKPPALSLSDIFSGVLAALEKTPPRPATPERAENGPAMGGSPPIEAAGEPDKPLPAMGGSPPIEIGSPQWALGSQQWVIGNGPWAMGNGQWTVGDGRKNDECGMMNDAFPANAPSPDVHQSSIINHQSDAPNPEPLAPSPSPPAADFKPAWQVDRFTWPRVCRRLMAKAVEEWDRLCDALLAASARGQKVLAIAGCRRGEGATTLLLCAASRLAERGIKTVLVDADPERPRLAKRLGVQPQIGWDETSAEDGSGLARAIVEAAGGLAVLPLREPLPQSGGRRTLNWPHLAACLDNLRSHYEMVLVDLGPLEDAEWAAARKGDSPHLPERPGGGHQRAALVVAQMGTGPFSRDAGHIDALVLVRNRQLTPEEQLSETQHRLSAAGIPLAGLIENFSRIDEPCTKPTGD